ncbi:uncharacterized protein SOCE26_068540 [Sorangium cellulosum]|uniref:Uncharacterized protein n=1 Tax=Sorangium cellulosum TaxID=56 RepID=A0A2L0F1B4_SORCE|nr:uncharacterized protein SOCE26_068540 [Sorangium cellulosum]
MMLPGVRGRPRASAGRSSPPRAAGPCHWLNTRWGRRAAHRCQVGLLVVVSDADIALWCAAPIETGIPGFVLRPPVLGREAVPNTPSPRRLGRELTHTSPESCLYIYQVGRLLGVHRRVRADTRAAWAQGVGQRSRRSRRQRRTSSKPAPLLGSGRPSYGVSACRPTAIFGCCGPKAWRLSRRLGRRLGTTRKCWSI